jgi:hypothetical protein
MQKWEYRVFASHLDPAELVVILNESGHEGWELVALARVTDYYPPHLIHPEAAAPVLAEDEAEEDVVPVEAFRYVFKRPLQQ